MSQMSQCPGSKAKSRVANVISVAEQNRFFLFAIKNRANRQKTVGMESTGRIFSENTRILLSAENAYFSLQGCDDER